MLSAFMVMFGFLIALPKRRREKRAEPRAGCAPLIPCLRLCTCPTLPAPGACPSPAMVGSHRRAGAAAAAAVRGRGSIAGLLRAPWDAGELCLLSFR